ncbi:MAG: 5'-deoxynucleotidase [Clostridia bacterium]|nr:5'-deoxynucleotidase [Clostridia bacterium]MDE6356607.1 5'-deoxynucleotidase [Clostridia bacterium]MDE7214595.1 5'-deoxynucleotidase [Clostridia bacterium]
MSYNFYAYMDRMKYIKRWQLMRSVREENIMEHTQQVALFSHALAIINNKVLKGTANPEKAVLIALYHECSEVMTGDLPTPIKYFNRSIQGAYKDLEEKSTDKLLTALPAEIREELTPFAKPQTDSIEYKLMKAADRLAAYVKCLEELRSGNKEFAKAEKSIKEDLLSRNMPEVEYFFKNFIPAFNLTLDELD